MSPGSAQAMVLPLETSTDFKTFNVKTLPFLGPFFVSRIPDEAGGLLSVKVRVPPLAVVQDQRGTSETSSTGQGDFAPGRQGLSAVTSWRR